MVFFKTKGQVYGTILDLKKSQIVNNDIIKEIINDWNEFLTERNHKYDIEIFKTSFTLRKTSRRKNIYK
jgi:hypothetical protein